MPLKVFYTMVIKMSKMIKNSNQGGPALNLPGVRLLFPSASKLLA